MRKKPDPLPYAELLEHAIRAVTGRGMSISELRQKLRRRAAEPSDIDRVIAALREAGALDDRRFAETFATSRLQNQGFGSMRVLRDLRGKRVAPQLAEQAVKAAYTETDETELIGRFMERKFRGKDLGEYLADDKNLMAAFRKLRLAGFSSGNAIRVLRSYSRRAEELDEETSEEE